MKSPTATGKAKREVTTMQKQITAYFGIVAAGTSLLLCSGCVTVPTSAFTEAMANQPMRSPVQIDASATVEAKVTVTPEANKWMVTMDADTMNANYGSALGQTLRNDIVTSGLFARIEASGKADYAVKVNWVEAHAITCSLSATEVATGAEITTQPQPYPGGAWASTLPPFMAALKAEFAANLQATLKREQEQAVQAASGLFSKASLTELITGTDKTVANARERNRAIIAAKNEQLPGLLREKKTEELSALVITIEQSALDLNHESEVGKDRAQRLIAAGGNAPQADEVRGLALSYNERIELLKPITVALKEEIANRKR
jgi:hypothetical protein